MFEIETDHVKLPTEHLTDEIKIQFKDFDANIVAMSLIPWEEHCTECAAPQCYTTCDLYEARKDGRCRRFIGGVSPISNVPTLQTYAVRLVFKRWAQVFAYANTNLVPVKRAEKFERIERHVDEIVAKLPDGKVSIAGRRGVVTRVLRHVKSRTSQNKFITRPVIEHKPDYFLCEIYNPASESTDITLLMRNGSVVDTADIPFQQLLKLEPGFNRYKIDFQLIREKVDTTSDLRISIQPNILYEEQEGLTLYFGSLTFVRDLNYKRNVEPKAVNKPIKIIAWDLDNTVWKGVLVEDGPENLSLTGNIKEIIETLDKRGIVNTIVSKNDHEYAMAQLERFELAKYFVFPKISWNPKSEALKMLVKDFNVGEDTFAFVDDSPFERAEVESVLPSIRIYDETQISDILNLSEFNPAQSTESSLRRRFYQVQKQRLDAQTQFDGDYFQFLMESNLGVTIKMGSDKTLSRIHELVQRTNQMNFSGVRHTREEIASIVSDVDAYDNFCIECEDRFGKYGMVGFAVVDRNHEFPTLQDFAMSCRVQSKRVEHAFLCYLLERYKKNGYEHFLANYRRTDRNRQSAAVFADLRFSIDKNVDDQFTYKFDLRDSIPNDQIIHIKDMTVI